MEKERDSYIQLKRLSSDTSFFNNVFKKTEKIISVVFYILSETKDFKHSDAHIEAIKDRALKTHELSLKTLTLQGQEQHEGLLSFQHGLVALDSTLRIANMARVIPTDIFMLLTDQIDSVLRQLNHHFLQDRGVLISDLTEAVVPKVSAAKKPAAKSDRSLSGAAKQSGRQRVNIPANDLSSDAYLVYSDLTDRAERIRTVLEAKPEATVKDISEIITDVSEKTIQRELNSLIEKGQVIREGERRWSKYSVAK